MIDYKIQTKENATILVKYTGTEREVFLPDSIQEIGPRAFSHCLFLTAIHLPPSVRIIHTEAFYGCHHLQHLFFSEGLLEIHHRAFWFCQSLTEVTFPESVCLIGSRAFECCSKLTQITLKNEGAFVDEYAFNETPYWHTAWQQALLCSPRNHKGIPPKELRLPEGVTHIDIWAYAGSKVESVYLPNSLRTIGMSAFKNCTALKEVSLTPNVYCNYRLPLGAGEGIFSGCVNLEQVIIRGDFINFVWDSCTEPDFLKGFDREKTFAGCTRLKRIIARKIPLSRIPPSWRRYAINGYISDLERETHYASSIQEEYEAETCRMREQLLRRTRFDQTFPLYEYLMSRRFITRENFDEIFSHSVRAEAADLSAALLEYKHRYLETGTKTEALFDALSDL